MEPEPQEYEGHRIELREHEDTPELLIDNVRVRYSQLPNGLYSSPALAPSFIDPPGDR